MNPNLLSVITPTFNCSNYIHRSYNNLCAQTYTNWEWIVVNDGSTDDSYEVINKIAENDERVKCYHFDCNKGRGAAREKTIEMSNSENLVIWDIDDLYDTERLSYIHKSLIINGFDFFCSYALVVTNDFKLKGARHFYRDNKKSPSFVHPTLAFNKSKIKLDCFYDVSMTAGEDFHLMMILDSRYNGMYCERYLMLYFEDREVNVGKAILANYSHYKSLKSYLIKAGIINLRDELYFFKLKVKLIILKLFLLFPDLYLSTISFRKCDLVDLSKVSPSIIKIIEGESHA